VNGTRGGECVPVTVLGGDAVVVGALVGGVVVVPAADPPPPEAHPATSAATATSGPTRTRKRSCVFVISRSTTAIVGWFPT
jgi:hypothetical protein